MKAILVVDIEEDIDIKTLRANIEVYGDIRIKPYYQSNYQFKEGVKLKPMPKKENEKHREEIEDWTGLFYSQGWNDCIDTITGETE